MTILLLAVITGLTISHEVGMAGDYTNQTYGVIDYDTLRDPDEWDTLDIETEARTFWNLDLEAGKGGTRFTVGNDFDITTRSLREGLSLTLGQELAENLGLELRNNAEGRWYHDALPSLADTGFQKDYLTNTSDLELDLAARPGLDLSASGQVQIFHYPEPDSFNYDYLLGRAGAGVDQELGGMSSFSLDYEWSRRWAAAADNQDFLEHDLDAELDLYLDNGPHLSLTNAAARRQYAARSRCSWEEAPGLRLGFNLSPVVELNLEDEARWTWYDTPTAVYTDLFENSLKFAVQWQATGELGLRAGPQLDAGRSLPQPTADDYRESSVAVGIDYMKLGRLWFSFEDRLGVRRYPLADSSFQSNYVFNEFNLMVNWTVFKIGRSGLSLNGMAAISPEWHADKSSDLSTRIFTLELRYGL